MILSPEKVTGQASHMEAPNQEILNKKEEYKNKCDLIDVHLEFLDECHQNQSN